MIARTRTSTCSYIHIIDVSRKNTDSKEYLDMGKRSFYVLHMNYIHALIPMFTLTCHLLNCEKGALS